MIHSMIKAVEDSLAMLPKEELMAMAFSVLAKAKGCTMTQKRLRRMSKCDLQRWLCDRAALALQEREATSEGPAAATGWRPEGPPPNRGRGSRSRKA